MPRALTGQWNPADARASSSSMMETSALESMNVAGVREPPEGVTERTPLGEQFSG